MNKTALLIGATGLIGSRCLNYLLSDDSYSSIKIITRRSLNNRNEKLIEYVADFEQLEKQREAFVCDDLFCCLGTTLKKAGSRTNFIKVDFEYPYRSAELALMSGAKQFLLVSSLGANKNSKTFYLKIKGEVEEAVSKLNFASVIIFQPSLLLGKREEVRTGERIGEILGKIFSPILLGGLKKYKPIEADTVAKVMVLCANSNYKGINVIQSDEISMKAGM
ncbi:MAG: oxidoreductase [Ignavibacteriaceae bacterium]|nr:oxidoreductase [Ignavibacteriaceae bacterium]